MDDMWSALIPFGAFFVVWTWLILMTMLRRKPCPHCEEPLSRLQSPFTKTKRQWWEGGYLCQSCGCESDRAGNPVPAGTAPTRRSIVTGIALLALVMIPALILLAVIANEKTIPPTSVESPETTPENPPSNVE